MNARSQGELYVLASCARASKLAPLRKQKRQLTLAFIALAVREGFEPSVQL
ncbi:MAG: hypothetical protein RJA57_1240 [Bacteroidota bacterium]